MFMLIINTYLVQKVIATEFVNFNTADWNSKYHNKLQGLSKHMSTRIFLISLKVL